MVSNLGIEINLNKIKAIEDITVVDNVKVIQRLTGRIAALGWFISRSSNKSHQFFSLLKKKNNISWTLECQQALEELRRKSIRTVKLTNNEDEYESMITGLELAKSIGAEERTLQHLPRDQNSEADALANLGSSVDDDEFSSGTVVQLMKSVIEEGHAKVNSTSLTWNWRNEYIDYLKTRKLPSDLKKSRALRTKAAIFTLFKGALFWGTFDGSLARCLGPGETEYALREVHEGTCGNHSGVESLVQKLFRASYYWIEMEKDAKDFVRKCDDCQRHAPMIHQLGFVPIANYEVGNGHCRPPTIGTW
uniref:Uncharacterized protein LOC104245437 n=1 Tax=Nicotiana sylvestris TaxID=4096 RepID=A0A1U7YKJ4_NICSY|nr:PREDICTED: uncharacterized protein LOC104245437 [Nicotiana sylvestris]